MTAALKNFDAPRSKYWTKLEYEQVVETGAFEGKHLYLFRGALIEMSPQSADHAWAVRKANAVMTQLFPPPDFYVNIQLPFIVPDDSLPEPDVAVCRARELSSGQHADKAVLVIEVAASSLAIDREKAMEYAAAGIGEYWIVDLNDRCVEIYRNPVPDRTSPLGFRYPPPIVARSGESITLHCDAALTVRVADLLP
jgi:Uma2 family endonuclease